MIVRLLLLFLLALLLARFLVLLGRYAVAAYRSIEAPRAPTVGVPLVPCAGCGVMVPKPRARPARGDTYLCSRCADG